MNDAASALSGFSTSTLSDAMDRLGIAGQAQGIMPIERGPRVVGRAYTIQYQPVEIVKGSVGDYIDDVPAGDVVVIDNAGRRDATVWGDILTLVASRRGVAGTVIDGICRDTERALQLEYPIFARGHWMRTGKDRVAMVAVNVPIVVGDVHVRPGDLVIGDRDGVVVVPADREADLWAAASAIETAEDSIRHMVEEGLDLKTARLQAGYHHLQSRAGEAGD